MSLTSENQLKLQLLNKLSSWKNWPSDDVAEFLHDFLMNHSDFLMTNTIKSQKMYRGTSFSIENQEEALEEIRDAIKKSSYAANDHSLVKLNLSNKIQYKSRRPATSWTSDIKTAINFLTSYQNPNKIPLILSSTSANIQQQNILVCSTEDVIEFCKSIENVPGVSSVHQRKAKEISDIFEQEQESIILTDKPVRNLDVLVSRKTIEKILNS